MEPRLPPSPFLYPIVDASLLGDRKAGECVAALARVGVRMIQFRAKRLEGRALLEGAREALVAARAGGCLLIVNDRPDVARILGADGVHVGQDDLSPRDVRALLPPGSIVGLSAHSLEQVELAASEPVDYVAVGPIFATRTKEDPDPVVGTELIRQARRRTSQPLVAIGGITESTAGEVVDAGADGVAMVSALLQSADLAAAARGVLAALGRAG